MSKTILLNNDWHFTKKTLASPPQFPAKSSRCPIHGMP